MWVAEWYESVVVFAQKTPALIASGFKEAKKKFPQMSQLSKQVDTKLSRGLRGSLRVRGSLGGRSNSQESDDMSHRQARHSRSHSISSGGNLLSQKQEDKEDREKVIGWFESDLEMSTLLPSKSFEQVSQISFILFR